MDVIQTRSQDAHQKNVYWKVTRPAQSLQLAGAPAYVRHMGSSPEDPFVYYPDLRMAGKVSDIVNALNQTGMTTIPVGELYEMTSGSLGQSAGMEMLTPNTILRNSFDPTNPQHAQFIQQLAGLRRGRQIDWNEERWMTDLNNPQNGRVVTRREFEDTLRNMPESQRIRYEFANDFHWDPESGDYEEAVRALGPNYDAVYNALGWDTIQNIARNNPEVLRSIVPLDQNDPSVRFLNNVLNRNLIVFRRDWMDNPREFESMGSVFGLRQPNGSMKYTVITRY